MLIDYVDYLLNLGDRGLWLPLPPSLPRYRCPPHRRLAADDDDEADPIDKLSQLEHPAAAADAALVVVMA